MSVETVDLMTFLKGEYRRYLEELGDGEDDTAVVDEEDNVLILDSFLNWSKRYLGKENQPSNVAYLPLGLGLRLMHGQTVCFAEQPVSTGQMYDEGVHITRPKTIPGMHGISDTSAINIFGG